MSRSTIQQACAGAAAKRAGIILGLALMTGGCGGGDEYSVTALISRLESDDVGERSTAVSVLKTYGPAAAPAVEALSAALSDRDQSVRISAAYALAAIGADAAGALPALLRALTDADAELRLAAAYAIPVVAPGDESVLPALKTAMNDDPDLRVRVEAAKALRKQELALKYRTTTASRQND